MGGVTLPTASTPGYGAITRNDRTYVGCDCTIAFLLAGERLGLARGLLKEGLDIVQLTGNAAASGGVHRLGAAFDVKQFTNPWVVIWREMGSSFWPRLDPNPGIPGDLWDGNEHGHGGIDCEHNSLIAYQNVAYWRGYNGLGQGWYGGQYLWGYGSKDNTFRPKVRRTWREGIAWADAQVAALAPPIPEEDIVASLDDVKKAVRDEIAAANLLNDADGATLRSDLAWQNKQAARQDGLIAGLSTALQSLASGQGVDLAAVEAAAEKGASAALATLDATVTLKPAGS